MADNVFPVVLPRRARILRSNLNHFRLIPSPVSFVQIHNKCFHFSVKREPSTDEPSSPLEATSPGSILRNNNGESLKKITNDVYEMLDAIIAPFIKENK